MAVLALLVFGSLQPLAAQSPEDDFWTANDLGDAAHDAGEYAAAAERYRVALSLARENQLGEDLLGLAAGNLGAALFEIGRYEEAEPLFSLALEVHRKLLEPDDPELAISLENLAFCLLELARAEEAAALLREALRLREAAYPDGWETRLDELIELATLFVDLERYEEAEPLYRDAISRLLGDAATARRHEEYATALASLDRLVEVLADAAGDEPHPLVLTPMLEMASIAVEVGDLEAAAQRLGQIEELAARLGGVEAEIASWILMVHGDLLEAKQDLTGALESLRGALELSEEKLGAEHGTTAEACARLGAMYRRLGRLGESERMIRRSLEIYQATLDPLDPRIGSQATALAVVLADQGRYEEARPLFEESLARARDQLGPRHPTTALRLMNLGMLFKDMGRLRRAEELVGEGLALQRQVLPETSGEISVGLGFMAAVYRAQGRYREAEASHREALAIDALAGTGSVSYTTTLGNLGLVLADQAKYTEAEEVLRQALENERRILGAEHPQTALAMDRLATVLHDQGRYAEAVELLTRSLELSRGLVGEVHPYVATHLNNLAMTYAAQGRFTEAEELLQTALAIQEELLGADHGTAAGTLGNLATVFEQQGRYRAAEPLLRRAFEIAAAAYGKTHPSVARAANNLGHNLFNQERDEEALELYLEALEAYKATVGLDHPELAVPLENAGHIGDRMGDLETAGDFFRRSLAISRRALGPDHPRVGVATTNLAMNSKSRGRLDEARQLLELAIGIFERSVGGEHPFMAGALDGFAHLLEAEGKSERALEYVRRASLIQEARFRRSLGFRSSGHRQERLSSRPIFVHHVALAAALADSDPGRRPALLEEGFRAGQLARATSSAEALAQMARRFSRGGDTLAGPLRARQDALERWREADRRLIEALSYDAQSRDAERIAGLRAARAELDRHLARLDGDLARDHPRFVDLQDSAPVRLGGIQDLLAADEALLSYVLGDEESFLAVVRRDRASLLSLDIGSEEVAEKVAVLRAGVDSTGVETLDDLPRFDVETALDLHDRLVAPALSHLEGATTLLVVPDGALQSLPFAVLVSKASEADLRDLGGYAQVSWLAVDFAIAVLPSVGSLRSLRGLATGSRAQLALGGFGDPVLEGSPGASRGVRGADLLAGEIADVQAIRRLDPLPNSASELREIARLLQASSEHLFLGERATETVVKQLDLSRYRVVAFATHALVAGEFEGLAEPALVLTPPQTADLTDDGLLVASEVARLELDADWVLLSACNTAAPDGTPGAEGLSGLTRAFLYAGSRSLLVSHWPVASVAAERLTTGMFRVIAEQPGISRAEALRQSSLALIHDEDEPYYAHPIFWAPFVLVGENRTSGPRG